MELIAPALAQEENQTAVPMPSGWKRRRENVQLHIEHIALSLLASRSADTVTIEEIAAAAGLSRRSFYRYFTSIEDILRAPLKRKIDIWAEALREQPAEEALITSFYSATAQAVEHASALDHLHGTLAILERNSEIAARVKADVQTYCSDIYFEIISERLRVRGEDTRTAKAVAAAFAALMFQVGEDCARDGELVMGDRIDLALSVLITLLGENGSIAAPRLTSAA